MASISSDREDSAGFQTVSFTENTPINRRSSDLLLHLIKIQFYGCRTSENGYHDAKRRAVVVNLVDRAGEILERPISNLDGLAFVEPELRFGVLGRHLDAVQDAVHVIRGEIGRAH